MTIQELHEQQVPIEINHPEHGIIFMHIESVDTRFGVALLEGLTMQMQAVSEHVGIAWLYELLQNYELGAPAR
jgi:hypothetical protein